MSFNLSEEIKKDNKRTGALGYLTKLPDVFNLNTFSRYTGLEEKVALVYLSRWKEAGYILDVGARAGVYLNKLKNPDVISLENQAVKLIYPEMVFVGVERLREAGWMTQIASQKEVAVAKRKSYVSLHNYDIQSKPKSWFKRYFDGIDKNELDVRSLKPEYALVDLCESNLYIPDPDDLFMDKNELQKTYDLFKKLSIKIPDKLSELFDEVAISEKPQKKVKL